MRKAINDKISLMGGDKFTREKSFDFVNNLILERIDKLIKDKIDTIVTPELIYEALKERFDKSD
jgi:hypothetical protein